MTRAALIVSAAFALGWVLGRRGIPRTVDEADRLREAIEERELARAMFAYSPIAESVV